MSRRRAVAQVNQFVGGLNTEASLINFPNNFTTDEINVELNSDGSRSQRQGFDAEVGFSLVETGVTPQSGLKMGRKQFRWANPGGFVDRQVLVVQLGNYVGFHEILGGAISDERLYSTTVSVSVYGNNFNFAIVDGLLVMVTGEKAVRAFTFDGTSVEESEASLLIRDFFGVADPYPEIGDLLDRENLQYRPETLTLPHIYNLRNQTFALPRPIDYPGEFYLDYPREAIERFRFRRAALIDTPANGDYPSNSDNITGFIYANPALTGDVSATMERFQGIDMASSTPDSNRAPSGYFVIDALERGASRTQVLRELEASYPQLTDVLSGDLAEDTTPDGPRVLSQFAGRVWYGGFSSVLEGGDKHSPKLSSYVLFSKIVRSSSDINLCYQDADPTSHKDADLTDADGGFLKVDGAYGIKALIPLEDSLFILAENGVWRVYGTDGASFTATSYGVSKVTSFGCSIGTSALEYGGSVFFWGAEGIYRIFKDPQTNAWTVQDITRDTIKTLYEDIPISDRETVITYYDHKSYNIRWLYGVDVENPSPAKELVLSTKFNSFTRNEIDNQGVVIGPTSVSGGQAIQNLGGVPVTVGLIPVTVEGQEVTASYTNNVVFPSSSFYCIVTRYSPTLQYTFGGYSDETHEDWTAINGGTGFWPESYIITGPVSAPDPGLRKDVPYLTLHFPYLQEGASCVYSGQWGWSNSNDSGRWTIPREGYRLSFKDDYLDVVTTRNMVRGSGQAISFKFESNGSQPLHLLGWSYGVGTNERA